MPQLNNVFRSNLRILYPILIASLMIGAGWSLFRSPDKQAGTAEAQLFGEPIENVANFSEEALGGDISDSENSDWGDFDLDGDLDLVVAKSINFDNSSVSVARPDLFINEGGELVPSDWRPNPIGSDGAGINKAGFNYVKWGDIDQDGYLDLVASTWNSGIYLYRNEGGELNPEGELLSDKSADSMSWGDAIGMDGYPELAISEGQDANIGATYVFTNSQGVLASEPILCSPPDFVSEFADMNNDGTLDLVSVGYQLIIVDNPTGSLNCATQENFTNVAISGTNEIAVNPSAFTFYQIAIADVDADGDQDMLVPNYGAFQNNLDGTWNRIEGCGWDALMRFGFPPGAVSVLDVMGTGYLNLVADTATNLTQVEGAYIYANPFDPTVSCQTEAESILYVAEYSFSFMRGLSAADVDFDGDPELVITGREEDLIFENFNETAVQGQTLVFGYAPNRPQWLDWSGDRIPDVVFARSDPFTSAAFSSYAGHFGIVEFWEMDDGQLVQDSLKTIVGPGIVDLGDVNGDNQIDLVTNDGIFVRQGNTYSKTGTLFEDPITISSNLLTVDQIECMDVDGNFVPCENEGTTISITVPILDLAVFDIENDGDLDVISIDHTTQMYLHRNDGQGNFTRDENWAAEFVSTTYQNSFVPTEFTIDLADIDADGDLDVGVTGVRYGWDEFGLSETLYLGPSVYLNENGQLSPDPYWEVQKDTQRPRTLAWGDYNLDGYPDLAVGQSSGDILIFENQGGVLSELASIEIGNRDEYGAVAWLDFNGDGWLDLAAGGRNGTSLFVNHQGEFNSVPAWTVNANDLGGYDIDHLAWNGEQLLVSRLSGSNGELNIFNSPSWRLNPAENISPILLITDDIWETPADHDLVNPQSGFVPIEFTLSDSGDTTYALVPQFKQNGEASWQPAVLRQALETIQAGTYSIEWDVEASGLRGISEDVVFRVMAIPTGLLTPGADVQASTIPNLSAQTEPFKVSGAQIQVVFEEDGSTRIPIENALVYRQEISGPPIGFPMGDLISGPYRTNSSGILQGSGELEIGDQLVALVPVSLTGVIDTYFMSAAPTESGVNPYTVFDSTGTQEIVVTDENPLMLINLNVSLEWDASSDPTYLNQLSSDLERTSEILFDLTNGQAALGNVSVYMDKLYWETADIQVLADNTHRPNAALGGIVSAPISDTLKDGTAIPNAIMPGQIRMAATWSRYGTPGGTLGEDWPRTLAHEIGHFIFFQLDNYLGVDPVSGLLVTPDCPGSAMTDAYRPDFSEFLGETVNANGNSWNALCENTVAELTTGRSDWETIQAFYPFLDDNIATTGIGPTRLPIAVTLVEIFTPEENLNPPLSSPVFYPEDENGETVSFGSGGADVYLIRTGLLTDTGDDDIIPIGEPVGPAVNARGASPNDRLCVFDERSSPPRIGCIEAIKETSSEIVMRPVAGWQPDIQVSPVNSVTIGITVTQPLIDDDGQLNVQLFPSSRPTDEIQALTAELNRVGDSDVFTAEISFPVTIFSAYVRVWEDRPRSEAVRESIILYTLSVGLNDDGSLAFPTGDGAIFYVTEGFETSRLIGSGTSRLIGSGTSRLIGSGTSRLIGSGTSRLIGSGTSRLIGSGTSRLIGSGTSRLIGSGTSRLIGSGTSRLIGSGTSRLIGSGTSRLIGSGANINLTFNAPMASPDGQVILFNVSNILESIPATTLQKQSQPPSLPAWLTPVGDVYQYTTLTESEARIAMQFQYLTRDVPGIDESLLQIFFSPIDGDQAGEWQPLDTLIDEARNQASALTVGNGYYAVVATIEMPDLVEGWNLIGNPVAGSLPVTEALGSLAGNYAIIYGYDNSSLSWQVFDPAAAADLDGAIELNTLDFASGYWIYITETAKLYLPVGGQTVVTQAQGVTSSISTLIPPAVFIGDLTASSVTTTTATAVPVIQAIVPGSPDKICAEGLVSPDEMSFTLVVPLDSPDCDLSFGDQIEFVVDGVSTGDTAAWTNLSVTRVDLER